MALRFRQACWPNCAPCATCGPLTITAGTCVSRQGNGNLCGSSKLLNFNSGDWNLRKFKSTTASGQLDTCWWQGISDELCMGHYQEFCINYSAYGIGTMTWDVSSCTKVGNNVQTDQWSGNKWVDGGCGTVVSPNNVAYGSFGGLTNSTIRPSVICISTVLAELTRTINGASWQCLSGGGIFVGGGALVLQLHNPDSVDAALARGGVGTGSSCRTSPGTIGTTSAGAEGTLAVTGPRSVKVPFTLGGVTPGTYSFVVDLDVYNTSDVFQGAETSTITVELEEADITDCQATYWYDVPLRTGERVQFVAVRDLAAA